jgi:hypothetical protein
MRFPVGDELAERVRDALLEIPEDAWVRRSIRTDLSARPARSVRSTTGSICPAGLSDRSRSCGASARTPARSCRSPTTTATASKDPHRPRRPGHRRGRVPPPPTRARRDRLRNDNDTGPGQIPVQGVSAQRGVPSDRAARARPDRLDPGAGALNSRTRPPRRSPLPRIRAERPRTLPRKRRTPPTTPPNAATVTSHTPTLPACHLPAPAARSGLTRTQRHRTRGRPRYRGEQRRRVRVTPALDDKGRRSAPAMQASGSSI